MTTTKTRKRRAPAPADDVDTTHEVKLVDHNDSSYSCSSYHKTYQRAAAAAIGMCLETSNRFDAIDVFYDRGLQRYFNEHDDYFEIKPECRSSAIVLSQMLDFIKYMNVGVEIVVETISNSKHKM